MRFGSLLLCATLGSATLVAATPARAQNKDPLGLKGAIVVIPKTNIPAKELPGNAAVTIHADTALMLSPSDNPSADGVKYKVFTGSSPCATLFGWGCTTEVRQSANKSFVVEAEDLQGKILVRRWTTGVLVVPYKMTLASHSLASGSVTVGPYAGYTTDWLGSEWTFPLAAGITRVSVPSQNGIGSNTEKAGISVATGILFNPGGSVKTGLLLGVDQLGNNSGYKDNGKVWIGLYVGAGFGN